MKSAISASILFPYTFWILSKIIPSDPSLNHCPINPELRMQSDAIMKANYEDVIKSLIYTIE
jgi:hypothetical protein